MARMYPIPLAQALQTRALLRKESCSPAPSLLHHSPTHCEMEPVGLAVGIAGLAGLFTTCIECFNIVQQGRYFGRDCWILETKYANQRLRLQTWGRACGFADASLRTNLPWNEDVQLAVEATLQRMAGLFQDHKTLHRRYGVSMVQSDTGKTPASGMLEALASRVQMRASGLIRAHTGVDPSRSSSFSRRPALPTAVRWAIVDKRKFADLVQHMKDFNDDLEDLTTELNVRQRQRDLIREEVGSIIDVEELETIEVARMGTTDPVADAASLRLCQIQDGDTRPADPPARDGTIPPEVPCGTPRPASLTGAEWEILDQPVFPGNADSAEPVSYQVLHKVLCDSQPTAIFFDEPSYRTTSGTTHQWLVVDECNPLRNPAPLHLAGKRELSNLDPYLEQNSHLDFVLFKEYTCSHDITIPRTAVSTESSIYLVSDALCSSLKSLNLEADPPLFCPTLELRSPYEWVYHNDDLIKRLWFRKLGQKEDAHLLRAAEGLLSCIQGWMGNVYQPINDYRAVSWERLPLIFVGPPKMLYQGHWRVTNALVKPPGGLVIERNSEGEDDDRAFTQVGPVRFTRTTDEESSEVLEITVTARLDKWTSKPLLFGPHLRDMRKLHIPRSYFDNPEQGARISDLPVYPHKWADHDEQKYLAQRGLKYESLACGSHWVTYQPESETGFADAGVPLRSGSVAIALLTMSEIFRDSISTSSTRHSTNFFTKPHSPLRQNGRWILKPATTIRIGGCGPSRRGRVT